MTPALIAALLPLVPGLISGAEQLFSAMQKSGPNKLQAVAQAIRGMVGGMITGNATLPDGTVPVQPDQSALEAFIESAFQQLKANPAAPVAADQLFIVRGPVQALSLVAAK